MRILRFIFEFVFIFLSLNNAFSIENVSKKKTINEIFGKSTIERYSTIFENDNEEVISIVLKNDQKKNIINKDNKYRTALLGKNNQIFKNGHFLLSLYASYDLTPNLASGVLNTKQVGNINLYDNQTSVRREAMDVALGFSFPTKFWGFHGRFTISVYSFLMKQNIHPMIDEQNLAEGFIKTKSLLGEISQEVIFGSQNLYITFGFGISYLFLIEHSANTHSSFDDTFAQINPKYFFNNSEFNWLVKASLGHRFDFGLVLELTWKHYSNGEIFLYNWGFNYLGFTIGFVF